MQHNTPEQDTATPRQPAGKPSWIARLSGGKPGRLLLIVGILLFAANLRAPVTAIAPLLTLIQESFGLTAATAGIVTAIPLLVFGIVSPLAPLLARRVGLERALTAALLLIFAGIVLRSLGWIATLFAGTCAIGVGIAIGNVLLPSLLKRDFPNQIGTLTAVYALTMGAAAAFASAIVYPLAETTGLGWPFALLGTAVFTLIGLAVWIPIARRQPDRAASATVGSVLVRTPIWRYAISWQITCYIGLNSFLFYAIMSWLPAIMHDAGYTPTAAGNVHGLMQLGASISGLLLMPLIKRASDQRLIAMGISGVSMVGILGLLLLPGWSTIWATLFGLGNGGTFILALSFIATRVSTAAQAASLSGMAQSLGYLVASTGPSLLGSIHDLAGSWRWPLALCAILGLGLLAAGWLSGRPIKVSAEGKMVAA